MPQKSHSRQFFGSLISLTGITEEGELPQETRTYLERIERSVEVPVAIASVGGDRSETIYRHGFRGI
jgi:adenylosuccinate synthase